MSSVPIPFDNEQFESLGKQNGYHHWVASEVMGLLGYDDLKKFNKAVNDARRACLALNLPIDDNFTVVKNNDGPDDFHLSRFACYMTAMNGDPAKPEIAGAQAYFAMMAEAVRRASEDPEHVERVVLRQEVTDQEKKLAQAAKEGGVENYAFFQSAGYMGMYNMSLSKLKQKRSISSKRSPLDFMGKTELAANWFRVTQTEEKIKTKGIQGQRNLEKAAKEAGKEVRDAMIKIGGTKPEDLEVAPDIKGARSSIKQAQRQLSKLDEDKNSS